METSAGQLGDLIRDEFNELEGKAAEVISPAFLADAVFEKIDPQKKAPELVKSAAILELRQLARGVCRKRIVLNEAESEQIPLFDFKLQSYYPAKRMVDGELDEVYVIREKLTDEERWYNVNRLHSEGEAKIFHSKALRAETESIIRARGQKAGIELVTEDTESERGEAR